MSKYLKSRSRSSGHKQPGKLRLSRRDVAEALRATKSGGILLRPETVPLELTGRWIAWTPDGLKVLGSGDSRAEARANAGGHPDPLIAWMPPAEQLRPVRGPAEVAGP